MQSLRRILVIKLGSIGDIIHALPAVAALKQSFPATQIDWLVESALSVVLEKNPWLGEVIRVDTQRWRKALWRPEVWSDIRRQLGWLRRQHYDVALDFQGLWKSAAFGLLSGAKRVIGFDADSLREPACRMLYDERVPVRREIRHVIDINLELARHLGSASVEHRFDLNSSAEDEAYIVSQLAAHQVDRFVILNPGGGWETKNWEPESYSLLHLRLRQATGLRSVITWGPGEESLAEAIGRRCESDPPVMFSTTLPQFIALARRASLFVGGDTGPLHLAAACHTPIVGIFGPTDPLRNGPFSAEDLVVCHSVPCGPCYRRTCEKYRRQCMRMITVEEVFQAALLRLARHG